MKSDGGCDANLVSLMVDGLWILGVLLSVLGILELIIYHELFDATNILELAVWKAHMARVVAKDMGSDARQAYRKKCGSDIHVIIEGVLRFFSYNK